MDRRTVSFARGSRPVYRGVSRANDQAAGSFSGSNDRGITLIELLVVVAVLSVLAVGVTLPIRAGSDAPFADAALFQDMFQRSRGLAVHGRTERGLVVEPKGVRVSLRDATGWQPAGRLIRWQGDAQFVRLGESFTQPTANLPDVLFLPNGQSNAFEVRFFGRRSAGMICKSDGWSEVKCVKK